MKKQSNLVYLFVTLSFFTFFNFYLSNLLSYKLAHGWHFSGRLLKIVYIENTGAAFSILQNSTWFLIILSVIALLVILTCIIKNLNEIQMKVILFLSFLMSGIIGNLYERLVFGHVRDFFDLTFINFPIFNVSDIFINIGVLGIIILILLTKKPIKFL
jgi:signal peptidase II